MKSYDHLDTLESEAIFIMREVAAEFERPCIMFSGGKDSICLLKLAEKAFRPGKFPMPLLHVDTGHNFPEVLEYRDRTISAMGEELIVRTVDDAIANGICDAPASKYASRNTLQIPTLVAAIEEHKFDALIGGARRDENPVRAKERIFSLRDDFSQWDPRKQRPELWDLFNTRIQPGEHMRAFPISNWTELDVWQYIKRENIEIPSIYYSHKREVVSREGQYIAVSDYTEIKESDTIEERQIRYRTVGDMISTGGFESTASNIDAIIDEVTNSNMSERSSRVDDKTSEHSMEDRKNQGYF